MSRSYIPAALVDLQAWATNFASLITATPANYGLVAGDATTIQNTVNAFDAAATISLDPGTRTPSTIADRDAKRSQMLAIVRPYAILIRNNAGVTDEMKIALGLTVPDRNPTRFPDPTTSPILGVTYLSSQQVTVKYNDSGTPTSKAKPAGAVCAEVFASTSPTAITDPTLLKFARIASVSPFIIELTGDDVGKRLYIAARWVTRTNKIGPWSDIISTIVA